MNINCRLICRNCFIVALLFLTACSSGEGNKAPIADAGLDQTVRAMSKVLLSSRNSDDPDGAILTHDWRQVSGPTVSLVKKTVDTVSFDVSALQTQTDFVFEVAVTDNESATTADRITITAVPINDQDRFLTYTNTPGTYKVVAATIFTQSLVNDEPLTVTVVTRAVYIDNFGVARNITINTATKTSDWLAAAGTTGSGGFVGLNFVALAYNNPQLTISVPKVNIESIQRAAAQINAGDDGGIDDGEGDRVVLQLDVIVSSDSGAIDTYLYILDVENNIIAEAGDVSGQLQSSLTVEASQLTSGVTSRQVENLATSQAYYDAVDPGNEKTTFADWLAANNFPVDCEADLNCFHARYINNFDLAFARDMFVYTDPVNNNVSSYVINYPNFDTMIEGIKRIAIVAMEYSPGPSNGAPFTKFYTFVVNPLNGENERVLSMDFDGRGEKFMPGVCATCHGGRPNDLVAGVYPNEGNINSSFLPWDVDTLVFSDAEFDGSPNAIPLIKMPKTQFDSIHAAMKGFNQAVLATAPTGVVQELIEGWYGGPGLPNTEFDGTLTPAAWQNGAVMTDSAGNPLGKDDSGSICTTPGVGLCVEANNPADAETIYHQVMGPYCRACHNSAGSPTPDFASYGSFTQNNSNTEDFVFDRGTMPMSRRTMDQFWVPVSGNNNTAAEVLATHLNLTLPERGPSRAIAAINGSDADITVAGVNNDSVRLNTVGSQYGKSYSWTLQTPSGSNAALVGSETQNPAFRTDVFGDFVVELTLSNGFSVDTVKRTVSVGAAAISFNALLNGVFTSNCISCHGTDGGFTLDSNAYVNVNNRVNVADPENSLILIKGIGGLSHGGGNALGGTNSTGYKDILRWIQEGANNN